MDLIHQFSKQDIKGLSFFSLSPGSTIGHGCTVRKMCCREGMKWPYLSIDEKEATKEVLKKHVTPEE
jgi:hypothetical protein